MSVGAAIRIDAPDQEGLIAMAAALAQQRGEQCFVISIVTSLPYGPMDEARRPVIEHNLDLITSRNASPVFQEGDDVAFALRVVAEKFGVNTLFIRNGRRRFGRSLAEKLIRLRPAFQVLVSPHP